MQQIKLWLKGISSIAAVLLLLMASDPVYAAVSATDQDSLQVDVNGNTKVNKGDTIRHTINIQSTGSDATGMDFSETIDANTTLVGGSVAASPVAVNDTFPVTVVGNISINSSALSAPFSVTSNDFSGLNSPSTISAYDSTTAQGGQVVMTTSGANIGKFTYNPPPGFEGADTFTYTLSDNANAPSAIVNRTATVSITVSGMIWFINNNAAVCTTTGCGRISNPFSTLAAFNALNDGAGNNPADNDNIFVYESATAYTGGVTLRAGQKLIGQDAAVSLSTITGLTPPVGSPSLPAMNTGGDATTISNNGATAITLNSNNRLIGFTVGNANPGISGASFNTLAVGDVIINSNGQAVSLSTGAVSSPANYAGFRSITSTGGTNNISLTTVTGTLSMGSGALSGAAGAAFYVNGGTVSTTFSGNISQTNNAAMVSVSGGHGTGTLTFDTGTLSATNGTGLQFDNADGTYNFSGTTTMNGGDTGIDIINGSSGNFTFNSNTTITNPSGIAFNVNGGNGTITYNGTVSKASAGRIADIQSRTGGSVTFAGTLTCNTSCTGINASANSGGTIAFSSAAKTLSTGANAAVNLSSNTGATINFTNGGLSVTTTSGAGFSATGGGTVTVQGLVNTITSTTGTALNVQNTTIGAGGLTFQSLSANGGANGIVLVNTGSSGGLTVTGDGTNTAQGGNSSGGTLRNMAGADGAINGSGIYMDNTSNVVLRRMTINGTNQNFGIRGFRVNNFTLEYSTVNGTNGNSASYDNYGEGSVSFGDDASATTNGLTGSALVKKCVISGGRARNFSVVNTAGALNRLTITGTSFGLNQNFIDANQSLAVEARNSGTVVNVTVDGSTADGQNTFTGSASDLANFTGQTATTMDVIFKNNALSNNHVGNVIGGGSLNLSSQGAMTFNVLNNTMRDADGSAVTFFKASAGTSLSGTFSNNTIGDFSVADSGSKTGNGIYVSSAGTGTMAFTITNNQIHQINGNSHIWADNTGGSYTANFTITGNMFDTPGAGWFAGIAMTNGAPSNLSDPEDTVNVCAKIGGPTAAEKNTFDLGGNYGAYVYVAGAAAGHTFNLPGYAGGANTTNVQSFIEGNNTGTFTAFAEVQPNATASQFTGSGMTCPTP